MTSRWLSSKTSRAISTVRNDRLTTATSPIWQVLTYRVRGWLRCSPWRCKTPVHPDDLQIPPLEHTRQTKQHPSATTQQFGTASENRVSRVAKSDQPALGILKGFIEAEIHTVSSAHRRSPGCTACAGSPGGTPGRPGLSCRLCITEVVRQKECFMVRGG
jgi:hypothetical protein